MQASFDSSAALLPGATRTGSRRFAPDGSRLPCPPPMARDQAPDALYIACRNSQVNVVRSLWGKQADLSFRAYLGATPLHRAYFGGTRMIVELLQQSGADVATRDDTLGCAPRSFSICVSANRGFPFLVRARLAEDPTLVNNMDGRTSPLHEAARNNRAEIVGRLFGHGANPSLANGDGKTALDIATELGRVAAAEVLRNVAAVRSG